MYRKDSVVHAPGSEWIQPHVTGFLPYCSECCKKLLWRLVDRRDEVFHLDLHDLMECRNRCILCEYICDLFGQDHLEEHLARTTTNTPRLEENTSFKTANRVVYHSGGYTDLLTLLRAPTNTPRVSIECDWRAAKASPIVTIECDTTESCPDPNGHLDHVSIRISIQNHPTGIIHDSRSFTVHTGFGRAFRRAIWSNADFRDIKARSATVREWLLECQEHHPYCQKSLRLDTPLAARILAIQEQGPNEFSIKLVRTEGINLHIEPHVVLSHVWGGIDISCKTTTRNISQYEQIGIPFGNLTKTFQDAVRITAVVGFKYLWIDSLAIIQDDKEDWQRESSKMAAIFRAGTFTLSATSAHDGRGGCGLTAEYEPAVRFPGVHEGHPGFSARRTGTCGKSSTDTLRDQLSDAPVSTRAWILQESMLSRRTLHATYSQFVWQCGSLTESEDSTIYIQEKRAPIRMGLFELQKNRTRERSAPKMIVSTEDEYGLDLDWWRCVADYSKRSLTFSGDQYAAIAGIVQLHQDLSNDQSVVGLWKRQLVHHLAWRAFRDSRRHTIPTPEPANRRPSWTWMSYEHGSVGIQAPISLYDTINDSTKTSKVRILYRAQILQANVTWSGEPLTSDPSGSTIRIHGAFQRMPRPEPVRRWADSSPLHLDPGVLDLSEASGQYDTLALVAYVHSSGLTNQPPVVTTSYLVIESIESRGKDEYRRIGHMMLSEDFKLPDGQSYTPKGVLRDITLA